MESDLSLTAVEWLNVLGFGALLGAIGQAIRSVAGLKKLSDRTNDVQAAMNTSQLLVSLLIGAVAGALGALTLGIKPDLKLEAQILITLIGIGYAGTDFIEAFMRKALPTTSGTVTLPNPAVKPDTAAPAKPVTPPEVTTSDPQPVG